MTNVIQSILNQMIIKVKAVSGIKDCNIYSIDQINKIGQKTPQVLLRPNNISGLQQNSYYESEMLVDVILIDSGKINTRMENQIETINNILSVFLNDVHINSTACNVPEYTIDFGSDGIPDDVSGAGTNADKTVTVLTLKIIYKQTL